MTSRTEDEDLAQIKDWWQRNGKPLVTGGILAPTITHLTWSIGMLFLLQPTLDAFG